MKQAPAILVVLVATLLLAACAGTPTPLPARLLQSIELNNQAAAALARADYVMAERLYLKALGHDRAIENGEGIAIDLIGLAMTYQKAGRPDEALRVVELVGSDKTPDVSSRRLTEAALLRGSILLGRADWGGAAAAAAAAEQHCAAPSCGLSGRLANLKAQLAIVDNRLETAAALARLALEQARAGHDPEEEANAWRTAANVSLFTTPAAGMAEVERALEIDKQLALSQKIYRDLALFGRLRLASGEPVAARRLYARARAVAEADRNGAGLRELAALERELDQLEAKGDNHETRRSP